MNKPISDDKKMCIIKHENIEPNEYYFECECCKNNISYNMLLEYFINKNISRNFKCPLCSNIWSKLIKYKNCSD
jgi:hypothetical protein